MQAKLIGTLILFYCFISCLDSLPASRKELRGIGGRNDRRGLTTANTESLVNILKKTESIGQGLTCTICKIGTGILQSFLEQGSTEGEIVKLLTKICINLKIEDTRVCTAVILEFKDEVLTVFNEAVVTPDDVCGTILGQSCANAGSAYGPWNVTFPKSKRGINRKARSFVVDKDSVGSSVSKVLHLSDTHVDQMYMEGANTQCGEPLCCRKSNGLAPKGVTPAGKYGYYNCDTPVILLDNMLQHIKDNHKDIDYVLWTGDVPAHNIWNQSRHDQVSALQFAGETLSKYFPNLKVFPCIGNHEGAPVNSFPPPFINDGHSNDWLRKELAALWGRWLPADTQPTILKGGYYTALVRKGLRIISLNMNYCNNMNWWLMINNTDPAGQLQWMIGVLEGAEKNNEKVHVIGHIPPGSGDCLSHWSWNYYEIIKRYSHVITAQFFGHTHHDEFEIFYANDDVKMPANIAYIGPSVTPYTNLNPGYRIYEVDGDYANSTQAVLDHLTYIIDLAKANKEEKLSWELEYRATEAFGMKSLSPSDWNDLVNRMNSDDALFQTFNKFFYKSHPEKCTGPCKKSTLCRLKSARSTDVNVFCKFETEAEYKWYKAFNLLMKKC
ncbi:sphingomyelin phosphodiesterase-like [Rhopilema esculentum]|uniref:sphingomyelin phosphodiesterase-like n=1 Tax=Rhopilema esculentum TaxID=499914 RepID=UPI0031D13B35